MTPAEEKTGEKLFPLRLSDSSTGQPELHSRMHPVTFLRLPWVLGIPTPNFQWQRRLGRQTLCHSLPFETNWSAESSAKRKKIRAWSPGGKKKTRQSRFSAQAGRPTAELMKISPLVLVPTSLKHPPVENSVIQTLPTKHQIYTQWTSHFSA